MSEIRLRHCNRVALALGITFSLAGVLRAQPKPAPVNPAAPRLAVPGPVGVQRGTSVELTLTGSNLANPVRLWTAIPGARVNIPTDQNNGKDASRLRVRLGVPPDTVPGAYAVRLATAQGLSNLRLFCVDDLPQFTEADNNHRPAAAQPLSAPCVLAGRTDVELSDFFRVHVRAGERLSFDVLGHRLGSPVDPQITLYDAHGQRELPAGHANDTPGLQTDCRLTYTFKEAGDYLVEIRDALYRGGPDFWYRLRIGDFPCAAAAVPMAVKRGTKAMVHFVGPQVAGVAPAEVVVPPDAPEEALWLAPRGPNGLHGWPVPLAISDADEVVEKEPNDEPAKANRIPVPGAVTGVLQAKGDVDCYALALKKGRRYTVEAHTHELSSPAEVYLVVRNAAGAEVAKSNPAVAPRIDFAAAADGDYTLVADHLLYAGGPSEAYRITVRPEQPDFELALASDRLDVPQGASALTHVTAVRRGYGGPIDVRVVGSPDVGGRATVTTTQPASTPLLVWCKPDAPPGPAVVAVEGVAVIDGRVVARRASVRAPLREALAGLTYPPPDLLHELGVAVTTRPPFTLAARFDFPEAYRGGPAPLAVTAQRSPGFTEEIALAASDLPPNVAAALKNIPKNQSEVKVQLNPAAAAALGSHPFFLTGRAKYQNQDFSIVAQPPALVLALPFELRVEMTPPVIAPGAKAKAKLTARRKGGYQGPIAVELRNLPAKVAAAKVTIPAGKLEAELEVTAAADAPPADKADVHAAGVATAAGNQQGASPPFSLRVAKKN